MHVFFKNTLYFLRYFLDPCSRQKILKLTEWFSGARYDFSSMSSDSLFDFFVEKNKDTFSYFCRILDNKPKKRANVFKDFYEGIISKNDPFFKDFVIFMNEVDKKTWDDFNKIYSKKPEVLVRVKKKRRRKNQ